MRIVVLGYTTEAKELFATQLAAVLGVPVISRRNQICEFDPTLGKMAEGESDKSYQDRIIEWELENLEHDPQLGVRYLKSRLDFYRGKKDVIITGIHNSLDFISLFTSNDVVVWVTDNSASPHKAEVAGLIAIEKYLEYFKLHSRVKEASVLGSEEYRVIEPEIKHCLDTIGAKLVWQLP